jgi:hypothetical protein
MPWQTLGSEILVLTHMILPITYDWIVCVTLKITCPTPKKYSLILRSNVDNSVLPEHCIHTSVKTLFIRSPHHWFACMSLFILLYAFESTDCATFIFMSLVTNMLFNAHCLVITGVLLNIQIVSE